MKKFLLLSLVSMALISSAQASLWESIKTKFSSVKIEEEKSECDIDFSQGGTLTIKVQKIRSFLKCLPETVNQASIEDYFKKSEDALDNIYYNTEKIEMGNLAIDNLKSSGKELINNIPSTSITVDGQTTDVSGTIKTAAQTLGGILENVAKSAVQATAQAKKDNIGLSTEVDDMGKITFTKYSDEKSFDEAKTAALAFAEFMMGEPKLPDTLLPGIGLNYVPAGKIINLTLRLKNGQNVNFNLVQK